MVVSQKNLNRVKHLMRIMIVVQCKTRKITIYTKVNNQY